MPTSLTTLLDANLAAHRARWGFAPATDADAARIRVDNIAGSWPRVSVQMPDGRWLRVHSDRQPIDEAVGLLAQSGAVTGEPPLVCLIGAGLGYAIEALQTRGAAATKILVQEPEPTLLRLCLERRDWTSLIESGRLMMLGGPVFEGRTEAWRLVTPDGPDPIVVRHRVLCEARETEAREALQVVARAVAGARANDEARRRFAGTYLLNTLRNLPHIVYGGDPGALAGSLAGIPAVVVGAGPSLDANRPTLREVGERALIISTDTAWRPLATAGIAPALVVAADPSEINGRHLLDIPDSDETWLVTEASVAPRAVEAAASRVATFRVSDHHPWPWLHGAGAARPQIRVWGSVLTAAFDLALTCGCDPIVFTGADLAYSDERPYCRGTTFERDWAREAARGLSPRQIWAAALASRVLVTVPDINGRDVRTTAALIEFRNWLLARIGERADRRFINASGAGTLFGPGIAQQTLAAALADRPARAAEIRATLGILRGPAANATRDPRRVEEMLDSLIEDAAGCRAIAPSSPLTDWLAFGRPSLTREEIHDALVHGREALRRKPLAAPASVRSAAVAPDEHWPLRMHVIDRVARLRAMLTGDHHVLDGISTDVRSEDRSLEFVHAEIRRALDALRALPPPLSIGPQLPVDSRTTPLSCRYTWTDAAAPVVSCLEEALIDRASLIAPHGSTDAHGDTFWTRAIRRVYDENEDLDADVSSETPAARDALLAFQPLRQWLLDEHHGESRQRGANREQRVTGAILRSLVEPDLRTGEMGNGGLQVYGVSPSRQPSPVRIDAVMRALTGTIVAPASARKRAAEPSAFGISLDVADGTLLLRDEPRYAFLGSVLPHIEPVILTDHDMPSAWSCYTHRDEDLAIVTPFGARHSLRVEPNGTWTRGPDWPIAISGEQSWAAEGGSIAWNEAESLLMLRTTAESEPTCVNVPFRPQHVAAAEDGSAYWVAVGGGLWEWLPGRPGRLLKETPFCGSLYFEDGHAWLALSARNARGGFVRVRRKTCLRYTPGNGELVEVSTGAAGCANHRATRHGWTARPYGCSDLVTIAGPAGEFATPGCYAPFRTAWSGGSLLVSAADGAILPFRNLADYITACVTGE
jgi:hypothetical protein